MGMTSTMAWYVRYPTVAHDAMAVATTETMPVGYGTYPSPCHRVGSTMVKVDPSPGAVCTTREPPWDSVTRRATARAGPVP